MTKKKGSARLQFPKTLYVAINGEQGDEFLAAEDSPSPHAEIGSSVTVAVYKLVEIGEVTAAAKFEAEGR